MPIATSGQYEAVPSYSVIPRRELVCETAQAWTAKPHLLNKVREAIRARQCSRRTEEPYVAWIRKFIIQTFIRDTSPRGGLRHPHGAGIAR